MTSDGRDQVTLIGRFSRVAHVFALLTALAIFPLILVGAGVTSKEAGMAFPDWPTSNGVLVNPPGWWEGEQTRWEHGHRLIGWVVGMLAIGSTAATWRRGGWMRIASCVTLLAIVVQGVMGGIRVVEVSTTWAMVHGVWGQLCFCFACLTALVTSRAWLDERPVLLSKAAHVTCRLSAAAAAIIFIQLVLGAMLRHFQGNFALAAHLLWVVAVAFSVGWITLWIMAQHPTHRLLVRGVQGLSLLLAIQLLLGSFAFLVTTMSAYWSTFFLWAVPTAHVAVGALLLAGTVMLACLSFHQLRPTPAIALTGHQPQLASL